MNPDNQETEKQRNKVTSAQEEKKGGRRGEEEMREDK